MLVDSVKLYNFTQMKPLILAIDFDGTIVKEIFPSIGPIRAGAVEYIRKLYDDGHYIIIWTCREGEFKVDMKIFLEQNDIPYHRVNKGNPEAIEKYWDARKIGADIYIDDRGILGIPSWSEIYRIVTEKAQQQ